MVPNEYGRNGVTQETLFIICHLRTRQPESHFGKFTSMILGMSPWFRMCWFARGPWCLAFAAPISSGNALHCPPIPTGNVNRRPVLKGTFLHIVIPNSSKCFRSGQILQIFFTVVRPFEILPSLLRISLGEVCEDLKGIEDEYMYVYIYIYVFIYKYM